MAGENRCSSDPAHCCVGGFPAAAGWDAATGLGTPNFTSIAEVLAAEPCFGVDCGGGVCNQGRCVCTNGHGYDEGGRCVPLKPFPKKLVEEVAALAIAGVWLLVQVCAFLNNCCCAKKGKDDKRGCLARCCACVCRVLCCGNELQLQAEDDDEASGGEMVPMTMERGKGAGGGGSGYSAVGESSGGGGGGGGSGMADDFESLQFEGSTSSGFEVASEATTVEAKAALAPAPTPAPAGGGGEVCSVCFLALPSHEVWCPYHKGDERQAL